MIGISDRHKTEAEFVCERDNRKVLALRPARRRIRRRRAGKLLLKTRHVLCARGSGLLLNSLDIEGQKLNPVRVDASQNSAYERVADELRSLSV
jgi:hypothetical protein